MHYNCIVEAMPQTCTICRHERRNDIDSALLDGESLRNLAQRTATSPTALFRHKARHIPRKLALAKETAAEIQAGTLFERLRALNHETHEILRDARETRNHVIALQAIGRVEKQIELEARFLAELDDSTRIAMGMQAAPVRPADDETRNMSVQELYARQAILLEAKAKIEALRADKPAPKVLEAASGSFETVVETNNDGSDPIQA